MRSSRSGYGIRVTSSMGSASTFGMELRRHRMAAGLSLSALARLVHYSKSHLSKVENGVKPASPQLARRCDAALNASGALAALTEQAGRPRLLTGYAESLDTPADIRRPATIARRDLLAALGPAFMSGTMARAHASHDGEMLTLFRSIFADLRRAGQQTSPTILLPVIAALADMLELLGSDSRSGDLLVLASRFAEYAGWMAQESGDDDAAVRWTQHAVQLAEAGGDRDLATYSHVRHALITLYRHDAIATIGLAKHARRESRNPRIAALAACREAQGHAIAGDYGSCQRSLDQAREHMAHAVATGPDVPVLGTSMVADPVAVTNGWCLHDLGRSREAAAVLSTEMRKIPQDAKRARIRYGTRLALALASIRELDQATALVAAFLDDLLWLDSATIRADLRHLARTLNRWHSAAPVRAVMPGLQAALQGPGLLRSV